MNVLGANFQNTVEIVNKGTYVVIINYERGCLFPVVPSILMELIMPHILCESEIVYCKAFSADGQNIAQNCTTMRVVETMLYWTAASPRKKICNQSSARKLRLQ